MDIDDSYKAYYSGPISDHFDGKTFFNPWNPYGKKGGFDLLRWKLNGQKAKWPDSVENPPRPPLSQSESGGVKITYIGHATILIQTPDFTLLTDPVFSERCSPFSSIGPKRVRKPFVELEALPKIDAVFVSHNHFDHLDQASLSWLARNHKPLFITPLGNSRLIAPCGDGCSITTLDWHEHISLAGEAVLSVTPAQHWSRRGWNDINRDLWGGFFLRTGTGKSVFFCADSGFDDGLFQGIRKKYGAPDIALIPIGAYEPRWFMVYSHMNPAEAVRTHRILEAGKTMGFHFETFQLTDEAFDAPRRALKTALHAQKIGEENFLVPFPGDFLYA